MTSFECPICGVIHKFQSDLICIEGMWPLAEEAHDFGLCEKHHDMRVAGVVLAIPVDMTAFKTGDRYAVPQSYKGSYLAISRDHCKDKMPHYDLRKLDGMAFTVIPYSEFDIAGSMHHGPD